MKKPREILLLRHRDAERRLDAIRGNVVAQVGARKRDESSARLLMELGKNIWLGLIRPSRFAWGALVIVWIGILALNFGKAGSSSAPDTRAPASSASVIVRNWEEQQRALAELLQPPTITREPVPATVPPRRSELLPAFITC